MSAPDVRRLIAMVDAEMLAGVPWPEPQPLPSGLPDVPAFEPELLPESFRGWVSDVAERMQCPPDYPAVAAMVAAAALIGRQVAIRPKQRDDWIVIPNLWGAVVGNPGLLKTPALEEAMRPLKAMEVRAAEEHKNAIADHEAAALVAAEGKKIGRKAIREALANGDKQAAQSLAKAEREADAVPVRRRYILSDTTVEKLGEILHDNPRGVLIFRDELTGFLRSFDREGRESDRAFYLEAWNGNGRYVYDRIGRGTLDIEACCVSILGGIQPGPLADYLRAAAAGGSGDDGLIQRFQLVVWPDRPANWRIVDRYPSAPARDAATAAFHRLNDIDPDVIGAETDHGKVPFLHFDSSGQEAFNEWWREFEHRIRQGDDHPVIANHLSKFRSLVPSLALVCHLVDGRVGAVSEASLLRAATWVEYLEEHARRLYWSVTQSDADAARRLANRIGRGDLPDPFGSRDVWRKGWSGLTNLDAARAAIDILCDLDWLREERIETAGRAKTVYHVNPRVRELPK